MGSCKWNHYEIPLHFDGSTSWFNFEELIDDRLDLTVLEARIRGPALKIRLVGNAEMHKRLFHRESLRAEDGVKYFGDTLRPHSIKEAQINLSEPGEETLRWSSGSAISHCS